MGVLSFKYKMKLALPVLLLTLHQVSADWSGTGEISCYGHLTTDVTTSEGSGNLQRGKMDCNIVEWDGPTDWDQRQCSSSLSQEQSSRSGLGTTMSGETGPYLLLNVRETSGTRRTTWVLDTALAPRLTAPLLHHGKILKMKEVTPDVALQAVLEPSHVKDVENDHQLN